MPTDLTREEIERLQSRLRFEGVCMTCVLRAPEPYGCSDCLNTGYERGEVARLTSARQEGYRAGVEAAAEWCRVQAYCAAIREQKAANEQARRAALLVKQTLDHAADVLPALSPPPAKPSDSSVPEARPFDRFDMAYEVGELLSCPFCGGVPGYAYGRDDWGRFVAIGCSGCGAGSSQHYHVMDDAKPHAASAWNKRNADARIDTLKAENTKLRQRLDKLAEGLRPFAAIAEHDVSDAEADEDLYRPMSPLNARARLIEVGDLRRASALLQGDSK